MTIRNVTTAAELASALAASVGGDTILLAPGFYGVVSIVGRNFGSYVTLRSADPLDRAILNSITVDNSAFIRIDDLHVSNPSNGSAGGKIVNIRNSDHIEFINSEINGKVDNIYEGSNGFYIKDSSNITLTNNYVHDVADGIWVFGGQNHTLNENLIDYIFADYFKFGGVSNVLVENNTGGGHTFPSATAHTDFMQFQASSSNVVIRGNVFLAQTTERPQGIFLTLGPYTNILIEQNIIYSGKVNAIKVSEGTGITAQFNTCLLTPNLGHTAAIINVPAGSSNHHNISTSYKGAINGTNIAAQWDDVADILHYDTLFENAMVGLGVSLEDLRPVPGSLAETTGAFTRLFELLGEAPAPSPDPTPPPDPDPAPIPTPAPEPGMIYSSGPHVFTGTVAEAVIVQHDPAYELAAGSLEVKFTAGALSTRKGIFSKDATGNGTGGHIGILAEQSKLVVRLQNGTGTFNADVLGAIAIGVQRHFVLTWGPGGMKVWLDGLLAASNAYTGGTIGNTEPIVIGGNQWGSAAGTSVPIIDPFTGTIDKVAIYDYALTEAEIGVLAGIIAPAPTPEELIAALQAMIADLEATIAAQDATIATLSGDLSAANIQVATLSAKIAAAQSALA